MPVFASTAASGGGAGTVGDPYTLKEAADNVSGQDIIYCRGGQYPGVTGIGGTSVETFGLIASGSGSNYTLVRPYEDEVVEFIALQDTNIMFRMPTNMTRVRFQNIIWTGNFTGTTQQTCISGQLGDTATHLDILDCLIRGFSYVTVQTSSTPNCRFLRTTFRDLYGAPGGAYGIYVNGDSDATEIGDCTFENISEYAIHHFSSSSESSNCRYYNNTFTNWASGAGGAGTASCLLITNGTANWVWNNVFNDGGANSLGAIQVEFGSGGDLRSSVFAHNAIYNPGAWAFRFGQTASVANTVKNNISHGHTTAVSSDGDQTPTQTTNSWQVAPSETAAQTWESPGTNFTLKATSSLLGAGTYDANYPTDIAGHTRPNPPDLGPYELGAGANPPVITIPTVRTTQVNVAISFAGAMVVHDGDLTEVVVYPESGSVS